MLVQPIKMQNFNNFATQHNSAVKVTEENKNPQSVQNTQLQSYPANYYLPVSFGSRNKTNAEIIQNIGEENFPNAQILENFRTQKDKSLYEIHKEYYAPLLECKTLDEAKELYPEFEDVIDASEYIKENNINKQSSLYKISQGKIEGANIETLSLDLLKKYYGEILTPNDRNNYFGLSNHARLKLFNELKIKIFRNSYGPTLGNSNPEVREKYQQFLSSKKGQSMLEEKGKNLSALYKTERGKDIIASIIHSRTEFYKTDEGQKVNEEKGRRISQSLNEFYKSEASNELRLKNSQNMSEWCKTNDKRISDLSRKLSWYLCPDKRNIMSDISKTIPQFAEVRKQQNAGVMSDDKMKKTVLTYYKKCEKTILGYQQNIGDTHSLMYQELKERMQKTKDKTATDEDLTILSSYYLLTKAQAPEYLDCFSAVEDTLLENEDTFSEAVNMMSDYYKNIQEKYPEEMVDKYFRGLKKVLEDENKRNCD